MLSPVFALRWLASAADLGAMLVAVRLTSYFVLKGILAAIAGLAVAGGELSRHRDAVTRLVSRSVDSAHKAGARLLNRMTDKTRSAIAYAGKSINTLAAATSDALHLPAAFRVAGARNVNTARAVTRPASMLRAVRRAAAAVAFAAPLMLAGAPAFAAPFASTNDTARIAAPLSAQRIAQIPIVINYAPNVVIHSEDAADAGALKRRVLEVLERHGRELHQTLQREIVRQQRRDF